MRRLFSFLKLLAVLGFLAISAGLLGYYASTEIRGVAKVLDGDSLVVGGKEIRLEGIDAPEYGQVCSATRAGGDAYPCGRQAAAHLRRLAGSDELVCTGSEEDRFGRLLARCLNDENDVNAAMVRDGWAVSFGDYEGLEAQARARGAGLWRGDFERPSSWRRRDLDRRSKGWLSDLLGW